MSVELKPGTLAHTFAMDEMKREAERSRTIAERSTQEEAPSTWSPYDDPGFVPPDDAFLDDNMEKIGEDVTEPIEVSDIKIDVKPCGYNILIVMPRRPDKTRTGIYRPDTYRAKEEVASVRALVVELGPDAYLEAARFPRPGEMWCKAGDWILIHPYTGFRFQCEGNEFRIIEDRHVLAVMSHEAAEKVDRINAA